MAVRFRDILPKSAAFAEGFEVFVDFLQLIFDDNRNPIL